MYGISSLLSCASSVRRHVQCSLWGEPTPSLSRPLRLTLTRPIAQIRMAYMKRAVTLEGELVGAHVSRPPPPSSAARPLCPSDGA